MTPSAGTVFGGKYRLDRRLATGGMGSVWIAEHLVLKVPVAIKLMSPEGMTSPALRARFEREALAAAKIRSPHVVAVQDYGLEGDIPFIAMELLEGEDLAKRLRARKRLTPAEAATVVTQVAKALGRAHGRGIIHRDLKPSNVFLARHDDDEIVKVLDFGIAKAASLDAPNEEATSTSVVLGTPTYMSPEQIRGTRDFDHRSDLWSLAVIAYRMLTGKLPIQADNQGDLVVRICTDPIPPPTSIAPDLPPALDAFFLQALARPPAERFQTAADFARAFGEACGVPDRAFHADSGASRSRPSFPDVTPASLRVAVPAITEPATGTLARLESGVGARARTGRSSWWFGAAAAVGALTALVGWTLHRAGTSAPIDATTNERAAATIAPLTSAGEVVSAATATATTDTPAASAESPTSDAPHEPAADDAAPKASAAAPARTGRLPSSRVAPPRPTYKPIDLGLDGKKKTR